MNRSLNRLKQVRDELHESITLNIRRLNQEVIELDDIKDQIKDRKNNGMSYLRAHDRDYNQYSAIHKGRIRNLIKHYKHVHVGITSDGKLAYAAIGEMGNAKEYVTIKIKGDASSSFSGCNKASLKLFSYK